MARDIGARQLANIAYGAGQAFAMLGQVDARLFAALAREAEWRMGDFKPRDLANIAWAFARVGQADAWLFAALAKEAEQQLFAAMAREAERHLGDFNP